MSFCVWNLAWDWAATSAGGGDGGGRAMANMKGHPQLWAEACRGAVARCPSLAGGPTPLPFRFPSVSSRWLPSVRRSILHLISLVQFQVETYLTAIESAPDFLKPTASEPIRGGQHCSLSNVVGPVRDKATSLIVKRLTSHSAEP